MYLLTSVRTRYCPRVFSQKLLTVAEQLVVSVPYQWPKGKVKGHINDPVSLKRLNDWMDREANYHIIVEEPFRGVFAKRLIAIYHKDNSVKYGRNLLET